MEPTEAIAFVRRYNQWRRGYQGIEQPQPHQIGQALDALCDHAERLERELNEWKDRRDGSEMSHAATLADLRDCKRELEQERQDRKQAELDVCRALGERNDARKELQQLVWMSKRDIKANIREWGKQSGLTDALYAYRQNAGGMARELAAQKPESTTDING